MRSSNLAALEVLVDAGLPTIIWGPPGVGKTSTIKAIAAARSIALEVVIASIREPSDFAGLPIKVGDGVRFAPPQWALNIAEKGSGIVFYDEISSAPPSVQAALLRPILDGFVGDLQLPSTVITLAAANYTDLAAGGWDLTLPLANRFVHLDWSVDPIEIAEGFSTGWNEPLANPGFHLDKNEISKALATVGSFIATRPDLVLLLPSDSDDRRAFPTPRSWEMAARILAASDRAKIPSSLRLKLLKGCVGNGPAIELEAFLGQIEEVTPDEVLENPDKVSIPNGRSDLVHVVLSAATSKVRASEDQRDWLALGRLIERIIELGYVDVALHSAKVWMALRPKGAVPPTSTIRALGPIMAAISDDR
ncbi:MAG: ATP-binding protein [Actinomycetota bacterium]|nr:ATP-binding protein [Actinomycetota bacterium]